MSVTIDANVLLYASDASSSVHARAVEFLTRLAQGPDLLYLFWPTLMAFLRISTHPAVFARPLSPAEAVGNVESLVRLAHVRTPGEEDGFWDLYRSVADDAATRGNLVSDAHVVALMRQYGVETIWTRDRDYRRFARIRVRDPFSPG